MERLFRTQKPDYAAAAFDLPGPTFRNDIYPEYKANRAEPDADLQVQFPYVRRLVEAMAIRCLSDPRYEADDILATIARRLSRDGYEVLIVTGDKDLMQCVTDRVTLYDPVRDLRLGIPEVIERFGVPPEAVVDVQGLMGDSTDNIPGVRGVGPKTATRLIQHFGSLENLLANLADIEALDIRGAASVRRKIAESAEVARLSKRLATVNDDVPIEIRLEDLTIGQLHTPELLALAEELEMERFAGRIRGLMASPAGEPEGASATAGPEAPSRGASEAVETGDWRDIEAAEVSVVLSADALGVPALGLQAGDRSAVVAGDARVREALTGLSTRGASFSGHDLKRLCRTYAVATGSGGIDLGVASYLYDPSLGAHDAADVTQRFLGEDFIDPRGGPVALAAACRQVSRLVPVLRAALEERQQKSLYATIEHPLIECLAAMEARGVRVDVELLKAIGADFGRRMADLVGRIYEAAGTEFNVLSHAQLRSVLFERLKLPSKGIKRTKSGPSTDSESLQELASLHVLPGLVLEYRGLAKLKSTYTDSLRRLVDPDGRIHTTFNQTVTATGRLSSTDPNLQNIPVRTEDGRRIRAAFVAPPGWKLVSADYNQIELRVLADISGDPALRKAFAGGRDVHVATASEVFEVPESEVSASMRRAAKVINYGIIYGMGASRMSRELGIERKRAVEYIDAYFGRYAGVRAFYEEMRAKARRDGYVETRAGRRRYLPDVHSPNDGLRQAAERVATNTPIQGGAADIIKSAMVGVATTLRATGAGAAIVLQIHDELLLESPESEVEAVVELTRTCMERAAKLEVPVVVDIGVGADWAAAH